MGFKLVKAKVIKALLDGAYEHEVRLDIDGRTSYKTVKYPQSSWPNSFDEVREMIMKVHPIIKTAEWKSMSL